MNCPALFICGVPRSGTTLLQRLIDRHPEFAIANDSHFIPRALELTAPKLLQMAINGDSIPLDERLVHNVLHYHRFWRLGIDEAAFTGLLPRATDYASLVSEIYEQFARLRGKPRAGEKTPDYVRRIAMLDGLFPNAQFIHIVRDGRDVALSLLDWATPTKGPGRLALWQESPIAACALWWSWFIRQYQQQSAGIPARRLLTVRYERLVEDARPILQQVCEFLGVEYAPSMLQQFDLKRASNDARAKPATATSAKKQWLPPTRGLRHWPSQMKDEDVQLFEALAGRELRQMGYPLAFDSWTDQTIELASRYRRWWTHHFESRTGNDPAPVPQA